MIIVHYNKFDLNPDLINWESKRTCYNLKQKKCFLKKLPHPLFCKHSEECGVEKGIGEVLLPPCWVVGTVLLDFPGNVEVSLYKSNSELS